MGHHQLLSLVHYQGEGSELTEAGLESAVIWNVLAAGDSLTHGTTVPDLQLIIFLSCFINAGFTSCAKLML